MENYLWPLWYWWDFLAHQAVCYILLHWWHLQVLPQFTAWHRGTVVVAPKVQVYMEYNYAKSASISPQLGCFWNGKVWTANEKNNTKNISAKSRDNEHSVYQRKGMLFLWKEFLGFMPPQKGIALCKGHSGLHNRDNQVKWNGPSKQLFFLCFWFASFNIEILCALNVTCVLKENNYLSALVLPLLFLKQKSNGWLFQYFTVLVVDKFVKSTCLL